MFLSCWRHSLGLETGNLEPLVAGCACRDPLGGSLVGYRNRDPPNGSRPQQQGTDSSRLPDESAAWGIASSRRRVHTHSDLNYDVLMTFPRNRSIPTPIIIPVLDYADVHEAAAWLSTAFGFVERLRIGDHRLQMVCGDGAAIARQRDPSVPPSGHAMLMRVADVHAHYTRALAHGARIRHEPHDYEYGERQYTAEDPAGHQWTFSETLADVAPEAWGGTVPE